ncbi:hypothetical protein Moror_2445 [Moniliophthora roreri MCA 2997]|uniref:Uncharacterized protein n=1 Tax=Moniliophthora roreri (strain MCA 2997) TaxID=1381753 RepID=V2WW14_MONRO|nr:hypothetical protein Moror_2445 [Moniliophthora roreri MCA 2997]
MLTWRYEERRAITMLDDRLYDVGLDNSSTQRTCLPRKVKCQYNRTLLLLHFFAMLTPLRTPSSPQQQPRLPYAQCGCPDRAHKEASKGSLEADF